MENDGRKSKNILKVNNKFEFTSLIKNLAIVLIGSGIIYLLNNKNFTIYNELKKPWFAVPKFFFPIIWGILYLLMALAAYRIYMKNKSGVNDRGAYFYYLVQLLVNFLWPFVFFTFRLYGISFILACVLLVLVIITVIKFKQVDRIAAVLMIPYVIWASYASILSFYIWMYNEM